MKKIERRAFLCKLLALLLSAGLLVFVVRWCVSGGRWAAACGGTDEISGEDKRIQ